MDKLKELRMTLVILVIGTFFISGCFFNNKHTVTFKTNGGSEVKNVTVKNGTKLEKVAEPKKDGYVFGGWYLEGEEFDFDSKIDEDVTLVAKWVKVEVANGDNVEDTTTTTVPTTTMKSTKSTNTTKASGGSTTKKTTKKTTQKPSTSTAQTNNSSPVVNPTEEVKVTDSTQVVEPTQSTEPTQVIEPTEKPDEPEKTEPIQPIEPTEPIQPTEPTNPKPGIDVTVPVIPVRPIEATNLVIEKIIENVVNEETGDITEIETIKIAKTNGEANFISNVSEEDLKKIVTSDMKTWRITANNVFDYNLNLDELKIVNILELKGFNRVTSLTIHIDGDIYIFEFNEENNQWILQRANVSVGTSTLDIRYFSDIQKAVNNARSMETVSLLSDIEVNETVSLLVPIIFDGEGYEITKRDDYLFDIENMVYVDGDELIFNNMSLNVDSLIRKGSSTFDKITINAPEGILSGVIIDRNDQLTVNNSNLLGVF